MSTHIIYPTRFGYMGRRMCHDKSYVCYDRSNGCVTIEWSVLGRVMIDKRSHDFMVSRILVDRWIE